MGEELRKCLAEVRQIRLQNSTINQRTQHLLSSVDNSTRATLIRELHRPRTFIDDDILELPDEDFEDDETWLCTAKKLSLRQSHSTSCLWIDDNSSTTSIGSNCSASTTVVKRRSNSKSPHRLNNTPRSRPSSSNSTYRVPSRSISPDSCCTRLTSSNTNSCSSSPRDVNRSSSSTSSRYFNCLACSCSRESCASSRSSNPEDVMKWLRQDADDPDPEVQRMRWALVNHIRVLRGEPPEIPQPSTSNTSQPNSPTSTTPTSLPRTTSTPPSLLDVSRIHAISMLTVPGCAKPEIMVPIRSSSEKSLGVQTPVKVKKRRFTNKKA